MNRKRNNIVTDPAGEGPKRRKTVACERCHSHKIKCSGDQPCAKCRLVDCAEECRYPYRDRQVKVSESYLEQILSENRRLKAQSASSANTTEAEQGSSSINSNSNNTQEEPGPSRPADGGPYESSTSIHNPLIGDRPWFYAYDPSAPPMFVGEAACTAFATRLRQFLTGSSTTAHIARTQFVREANIAAANAGDIRWPSLPQARLLVKIALRQISCIYHVLLRRSTLEKLEEIYRTGEFESTVNKCKFFALFAFGEAYSVRSEPASPGSRVPGTSYFARALSLGQVLPERTSITHLEILLLLSLFSYYLNRRHSAYVLIGSAMRLGLTIGLNHNIPESQLIDPVERQHRVRIWWTIYIFDRMWGSKMGLPSQVLDDDIHLDIPSAILPAQLHEDQFSDAEYLKANIDLARIVGETIAKLYSRRKYNETFLQRVQKLLKALKNWVDTLPEHLRLNVEDPDRNGKPVTSLHLAFNQCMILTTRPTLLHLLKLIETDTHHESISQPVLTLGEACIHAARHSHSLILTKWISGTLPVFGYFHAHYLFSSSLVLAMSSFVPIGSPADLVAFETGLEVLSSMSNNGNLAASEFHVNLQQAKACLDRYRADRHVSPSDSRPGRRNHPPLINTSMATELGRSRGNHTPASTSGALCAPPTTATFGPSVVSVSGTTSMLGPMHELAMSNTTTGYQPNETRLGQEDGIAVRDLSGGFTTAMAFMEPMMQDFLAQSDIDLGSLHPGDMFMNDAESLYTGHGL